jgi:NAD(P)-dependent dehydrogenase (short-subunit alcohol dehydrogenase family)
MSGSPLHDLAGRTAVVTGGAMGLGREAARVLAEHGAAVAVVDIDANASSRAANELLIDGHKAMSIACDVASSASVRKAMEAILDTLVHVDILVASAGIGDRSPAEEMSDEQWRNVLSTNLDGVWHFNREIGKHLIERRAPGSLINMASVAGLVGLETGNANYAASKGGIIALTRCLAIEWARHGIRVNAIAPTHFATPLVERLITEQPETEDYFLSNIPLGRLGQPADIRGPVLFLASDASAMVTGHVLLVDGGHTAR